MFLNFFRNVVFLVKNPQSGFRSIISKMVCDITYISDQNIPNGVSLYKHQLTNGWSSRETILNKLNLFVRDKEALISTVEIMWNVLYKLPCRDFNHALDHVRDLPFRKPHKCNRPSCFSFLSIDRASSIWRVQGGADAFATASKLVRVNRPPSLEKSASRFMKFPKVFTIGASLSSSPFNARAAFFDAIARPRDKFARNFVTKNSIRESSGTYA